jgi:hypothetical protein
LLKTAHIPPELVDSLIKSVRKCAASWLDSEIESSVHLYLLHGHLEPVEDKPPRKVIMSFRHHLEVPIPKHRLALTRLVLADHPLAVEQLRRASRYHPPVPRDDRLCRFCKQHVETPEHGLLLCHASPALCDLWHNFCIALQPHGLHVPVPTLGNAVPMLKDMLYNRSSVNLFAKFVYDMLAIVQRIPLYRS